MRENCTSRLSERAEAGRKLHLSRLYSDEAPVIGVERREQVIEIALGQPKGRSLTMQWGDGIPRDGTSRKMREYQIRFCERLEVKFLRPTRQFPGPTRQTRRRGGDPATTDRPPAADGRRSEAKWRGVPTTVVSPQITLPAFSSHALHSRCRIAPVRNWSVKTAGSTGLQGADGFSAGETQELNSVMLSANRLHFAMQIVSSIVIEFVQPRPMDIPSSHGPIVPIPPLPDTCSAEIPSMCALARVQCARHRMAR